MEKSDQLTHTAADVAARIQAAITARQAAPHIYPQIDGVYGYAFAAAAKALKNLDSAAPGNTMIRLLRQNLEADRRAYLIAQHIDELAEIAVAEAAGREYAERIAKSKTGKVQPLSAARIREIYSREYARLAATITNHRHSDAMDLVQECAERLFEYPATDAAIMETVIDTKTAEYAVADYTIIYSTNGAPILVCAKKSQKVRARASARCALSLSDDQKTVIATRTITPYGAAVSAAQAYVQSRRAAHINPSVPLAYDADGEIIGGGCPLIGAVGAYSADEALYLHDVWAAVRAAKPELYAIFTAVAVSGISIPATAAAFGMSERTVYAKLDALRRVLGARGLLSV